MVSVHFSVNIGYTVFGYNTYYDTCYNTAYHKYRYKVQHYASAKHYTGNGYLTDIMENTACYAYSDNTCFIKLIYNKHRKIA